MLEAIHAIACLAMNSGISGSIYNGFALWGRTFVLRQEGTERLFRGVGGGSCAQFLSSARCRPSTLVGAFMGVFGAVLKTKLPAEELVSA